MIYLDTANPWFMRQDFTTGLLEVIPQDEAEAGGDWKPFDGTQEDFDRFIGCQAPLDRIPAHLKEEKPDRRSPEQRSQDFFAERYAEHTTVPDFLPGESGLDFVNRKLAEWV